ncbi:hypothetical protein CCR97_03090 [Rhodoplanes elegans]|uniref:Cytochrome b561 bacterial/Ni-hydrogenase domain-containing protein n=1 Tax=Rhodoplanes elegans TaxID=29408 RepID=A0A327KKY4_9BRAD|nr:cytochrome b [Rhodoplanes elegans]MBK5957194.1 hypothetical protein [Rhodoplanes elegans]RAI38901.1 hypothetical protein CH338_11160 [Rhodoplanes elegans]
MPRPWSAHAVYGTTARVLHWTMAVLILFQATIGIVMTWAPEGSTLAKLSTALSLYDVHKLLGVALLALVLVRLANRIGQGVPAEDPSIATWQAETANLVHTWMYLLLIVVPLLGWLGVSLFPALTAFGITLPALVAPDQKMSEPVFLAHAVAAFVLIGLVVIHVGAALFHAVIRQDGVFRRMWPRDEEA